MTSGLSISVLMVHIRTFLHKIFRNFHVSILSSKQKHCVSVFVRLVDMERQILIAVCVKRAAIFHIRDLK